LPVARAKIWDDCWSAQAAVTVRGQNGRGGASAYDPPAVGGKNRQNCLYKSVGSGRNGLALKEHDNYGLC
jgi:hypothetical protein